MFHGVIKKITLAQFFWDTVYIERNQWPTNEPSYDHVVPVFHGVRLTAEPASLKCQKELQHKDGHTANQLQHASVHFSTQFQVS